MYNPPVTAIIFEGSDYFAAENNDGGVRFGIATECTFVIKPCHAATKAVKNCASEDEIEAIFDDFCSGVYGEFHYRN